MKNSIIYTGATDGVQNQIDEIIKTVIVTRKKKKISQVQLSKMSGIPQSTISRFESFTSVPSLQVLIKIANALELTIVLK